mgnify:CR=1 FL=1
MVERVWLAEILDGVVRSQEEVGGLAEGLPPGGNVQVRLVPAPLRAVRVLGRGGGVSGVDVQAQGLHLLDGEAARDGEAQTQALGEFFRLGDAVGLRGVLQRADVDLQIALGLGQCELPLDHLRLLRSARLLRAERQSRHIFYHISDHHISHMIMDLAEHVIEENN